MHTKTTLLGLVLIAFVIIFSSIYCNPPSKNTLTYLNHHDSVKYVGKEQCAGCHQAIYQSFLKTGMGQSFGLATKQKSVAKFSKNNMVFDKFKNLYYQAFWQNDSMYIMEFRLLAKDTIYKRIERVDYIIGSGQHTNSHLTNINGFVYQLPLTWYTQQQKWDLPPGFENGHNVRFSRSIEFECMSCHNAMPVVEPNSINKFTSIAIGIDCERCHGPGELHVKEKLAGKLVDTAIAIDYTIVNPRKLDWQLQTDICQRCHLQGNAILQAGKNFNDFKPGMHLDSVLQVFMPKFSGNDEGFIMASHAQRLQKSKCFIQSNKELKKDNKQFNTLNFTCINCHNPHISIKETGVQIFNNACLKCHQSEDACSEKKELLAAKNNNCVNCHMPKSGTEDIPHVTVHDHFIRKPVKYQIVKDIKQFEGLYCVNSADISTSNKAKAYLNYYEKFEGNITSLDSAWWWIKNLEESNNTLAVKIHYYYLTNQFAKIAELNFEQSQNLDAWTFYRIGQAFQNQGNSINAEKHYKNAVKLASQNLAFLNKLGSAQIENGKLNLAENTYKLSLAKQPKQEDAWVNLGFVKVNKNLWQDALFCYNNALALNPDNLQALLNRAAVYNVNGNKKLAINDLKSILRIEPNNQQVLDLLVQLKD